MKNLLCVLLQSLERPLLLPALHLNALGTWHQVLFSSPNRLTYNSSAFFFLIRSGVTLSRHLVTNGAICPNPLTLVAPT